MCSTVSCHSVSAASPRRQHLPYGKALRSLVSCAEEGGHKWEAPLISYFGKHRRSSAIKQNQKQPLSSNKKPPSAPSTVHISNFYFLGSGGRLSILPIGLLELTTLHSAAQCFGGGELVYKALASGRLVDDYCHVPCRHARLFWRQRIAAPDILRCALSKARVYSFFCMPTANLVLIQKGCGVAVGFRDGSSLIHNVFNLNRRF